MTCSHRRHARGRRCFGCRKRTLRLLTPLVIRTLIVDSRVDPQQFPFVLKPLHETVSFARFESPEQSHGTLVKDRRVVVECFYRENLLRLPHPKFRDIQSIVDSALAPKIRNTTAHTAGAFGKSGERLVASYIPIHSLQIHLIPAPARMMIFSLDEMISLRFRGVMVGFVSQRVDFHPTRGVLVNDFAQSRSNPNVYAVGDCVANVPRLTHGKGAAHFASLLPPIIPSFANVECQHATRDSFANSLRRDGQGGRPEFAFRRLVET